MALTHLKESRVAVAVAATAVVLSPQARQFLRRGAAYGLAGAMVAGDALASFARGAERGIREAAEAARTGEDGRAASGPAEGKA